MKLSNCLVVILVAASFGQLAQAWNFHPWSKNGPADTVDNRSELEKALEEIHKRCKLVSKGNCLDEMIDELDRRHEDDKLIEELVQTLHLEDIMPPHTIGGKGLHTKLKGRSGLRLQKSSGLGELSKDDQFRPHVVHRINLLSSLGEEKLIEFARAYDENGHVAMKQMFAEAHLRTRNQLNNKVTAGPLLVRGNSTRFELPLCFADYLLSIREDFLKITDSHFNIVETLLTMTNLKSIYEQVVKITSTIKNRRCVDSSTGSLERFVRGTGTAALKMLANQIIGRYFPNSDIDPNRVTEISYRLFYFFLSFLMKRWK